MFVRLGLPILAVVIGLLLLAIAGLALGWPGGSASAEDPVTDMHEACLALDAQTMDEMHQAMMGDGQMADWMASGAHCQH